MKGGCRGPGACPRSGKWKRDAYTPPRTGTRPPHPHPPCPLSLLLEGECPVGGQVALVVIGLDAFQRAGIDADLHYRNIATLLLHEHAIEWLTRHALDCVGHVPG